MGDFLIITAFLNKGNTFRSRNIMAVIDNFMVRFPDADLCVAEQNPTDDIFGEIRSKYGERFIHIPVAITGDFCKPKLLNAAVRSNPDYKAYVMGDADSYLDDACIEYIRNNWNKGSLVFPYSEAIYLKEVDTRRVIIGQPLTPGPKDHGVHVTRQTGLCNVFTKATFDAIGGFDEDFNNWGAEDDAFLVKCQRLVGPILRNTDRGTVYHLFHPVVNTMQYIKSSVYVENRRRCACIRRMTDDDLHDYVAGNVSLKSLITKYDRIGRLSVQLEWHCTNEHYLTIDTTIYDIDRSGEMTFTKILDEVLKEDGPEYVVEFIDGIFKPISDLSIAQLEEINAYREKACSLAKMSLKPTDTQSSMH